VGDESKSGDAIALRYGNLYGPRNEQVVIIVDGGYTASGEALVEHIKEHYGTERVDLVISTHPDQDHITGLEVVVEELQVDALLMHQPWRHSQTVAKARATSFRSAGFAEWVQKSLQGASDLEAVATRKAIRIIEPFCGLTIPTTAGTLRILGPTKEYYESLLQEEVQIPGTARQPGALEGLLRKMAAGAATLLDETFNIETLRDDGTTTPSNNSSVVCMFTIDGRQLLLTGDAGVPALQQAIAVLEGEGFQPGSLKFVQVPHHGSRSNVGPSILNRMLGPKGQTTQHSTAFASVAKKNPEHKHPAKKVTNAFHRRGYAVHVTQGEAKSLIYNAPNRTGWTASRPLPFYPKVEEDSGA
jgi:beta-lactamase superfamily II metal-dependent hydrolase